MLPRLLVDGVEAPGKPHNSGAGQQLDELKRGARAQATGNASLVGPVGSIVAVLMSHSKHILLYRRYFPRSDGCRHPGAGGRIIVFKTSNVLGKQVNKIMRRLQVSTCMSTKSRWLDAISNDIPAVGGETWWSFILVSYVHSQPKGVLRCRGVHLGIDHGEPHGNEQQHGSRRHGEEPTDEENCWRRASKFVMNFTYTKDEISTSRASAAPTAR